MEVGDHTYRLVSVPVFAFGLASGDVVVARHYGDAPQDLWVEELAAAHGHSAVRVVVMGDTSVEEPTQLCTSYGCRVETTMIDGLIAIDVPPETDFTSLRDDLHKGRDDGRWDYSVGVVAAEHERS